MAYRSVRPRFTRLDDLVGWLATCPTGVAAPLYQVGSDGLDANIIGNWEQRGTVALPNVCVAGSIWWSRTTDGGYGIVSAVLGGTTVRLAAGYTLPAAGRCRLWDTSAAASLGDVAFTRALDVVTVPATAGMAAGDLVYALNRSEFTIGAAHNIRPLVGTVYVDGINGGLLVQNGTMRIPANGLRPVRGTLVAATSAATNADYVGFGYTSAALHHASCPCRLGGLSDIETAYGAHAAPTLDATGIAGMNPTAFAQTHELVCSLYPGVIQALQIEAGLYKGFSYHVVGSAAYDQLTPDGFIVHARAGGVNTVTALLKASSML